MSKISWTCTLLETILGLLIVTSLTEGTGSDVYFKDEYYFDGNREATVVVKYGHSEGGICWDGMTDNVAKVLCQQNGDAGGKTGVSVAVNTTTIRLLAPGCHGSEDDIMDCPGSSWGDHQAACDRQLAARIECQVEDIDGTISEILMHRWSRILQTFLIVVGMPLGLYLFYVKYQNKKDARARQQTNLPLISGQQYPTSTITSQPPPPPSYGQAQPPSYGQATNYNAVPQQYPPQAAPPTAIGFK